MEVEVKLRLPDSTAHQKLSDLLSPFHTKTLLQENVFFDGFNAELSSNLAVLRLRFYESNSKCVISLKAKPVISDGISRVEEDEEEIDYTIARACVAEPWRLMAVDGSRILKRVREEVGVSEKGLVCLGGFRNVRSVYDWNGLKLEVDETRFDFGISYEIECESIDAEKAKKLIEVLLKENGISYSYSEVSKFAVFRMGKLPSENNSKHANITTVAAADTNSPKLENPTKKQKTVLEDLSKAVVLTGASTTGLSPDKDNATQAVSELQFREQKQSSFELYLKRLKDCGVLGYQRSISKEILELKTFEIDLSEFRNAINFVLKFVLTVRYYSHAMLCESDIVAEIGKIVPLTVDMCMSVLYAKLQTIHNSYGEHTNRYTSAPSYTEEVELPLPLALAIQDFGYFKTRCLKTNFIYAPTYPEGVQNEGRESTIFSLSEYKSFVPILKELGIPCKSVDSRIKTGSAWWTYIVKNVHGTADLVCSLPRSHYSDHSAVLRSCFLAPQGDDNACRNIVKMPEDSPNYGGMIRVARPGFCIRSFLALCHAPEEEWRH